MAERELMPGLRNVVRLIRSVGPRFEEAFFLGEEIDTFASFVAGSDHEYVLEILCLEKREGSGFEALTHELTINYRRVGETQPIYTVTARVSPNGLYSSLDVLNDSPNAIELFEFGNAVSAEIEQYWPERI